MHINRISDVIFNKNFTTFKSRVVYEDSQTPLSYSVKEFIDNFEESFPRQSSGRRLVKIGYSNGNFKIFQKANGESGEVYMIEPNNGGDKFVIKESFPLKYKMRFDDDLGGLKHEYRAMIEASNASERAQKPIAYVRTLRGSRFLLSKFIPSIVPVNRKTACDGENGLKMGEKYFSTVLDIIEKFDDKNLFDPDMTRDNVSIDTTDKSARILDFQWVLLKGTHSKYDNEVFTFVPCEVETNAAAFEGGALADYPVGELKELRKRHENQDFSVSVEEKKQEVRNKLKEYFKLRAEYAEKLSEKKNNSFEKVKAEVYKDPSDDVIDAELLRMSILRNNRLQYFYTDDNIEKPRNMMKLIRYTALAKLSASILSEFVPKQEPRNQAEKEYFQYMRDFGRSWNRNTSKWYPETVTFLKKVVEGTKRAPGRYFPELFISTKDEPFTLFDVMSNNDFNKKIRNVNKNVRELEDKIIDLKEGEYVPSYEINPLIRNLYSY